MGQGQRRRGSRRQGRPLTSTLCVRFSVAVAVLVIVVARSACRDFVPPPRSAEPKLAPQAPGAIAVACGKGRAQGSLDGGLPSTDAVSSRRKVLLGCSCAGCAVAAGAAGAALFGGAPRAEAIATLVAPPEAELKQFDPPRDKAFDRAFANGMAGGMVDYERAVSKRKRVLFERLWKALPHDSGVTVVEVGMGSFPNALYFGSKSAPAGMDIIGVDPNESMEGYARENADKAGLLKWERRNTLRIVHGVAEALPLETASADAVVCTLTLCSVLDPARAVAEIRRVLKPGGSFLFLEHVLAENDDYFASSQRRATPRQVQRADGCHLDRRTLETIKAGSFREVDGQYFELDNFNYLNPTVAGIAVA